MSDFHEIKRSAMRYWERRRIFYNLLLVLPSLLGFSMGAAAAARHGLVRESGAGVVMLLFVLWAIPANICYTFAYSLEFLFGGGSAKSLWAQSGRTFAFVLGTLFAMFVAFLCGTDVAWMVFIKK